MASFTKLPVASFSIFQVLGTVFSTTLAIALSALPAPAFAGDPVKDKPGDPVKEMAEARFSADTSCLDPNLQAEGQPTDRIERPEANIAPHADEEAMTCTCSGNLVLNPSFESGTANWTSSGGNFTTGTYAAVCGTYAGHFEITNGNDNWLAQTISSGNYSAGTVLSLSVFAGTHDPTNYATAAPRGTR